MKQIESNLQGPIPADLTLNVICAGNLDDEAAGKTQCLTIESTKFFFFLVMGAAATWLNLMSIRVELAHSHPNFLLV